MAPRAGDGPGSSTGPEGPSDGSGEAYFRYQEGSRLLDSGNTHAAIVALERARDLEPDKGSIREALARAYFRSGRVALAKVEFETVVELDPVNDYAHFGLALSCAKTGQTARAIAHLKLAIAMRPGADEYRAALTRLTS